jgi:DNA-binding HxlR family transcriptional regulator
MELENIRGLTRRIHGTWTLSILAHLHASGSSTFTGMLEQLSHPDTGAPICRQALSNALATLRGRGVVTRDEATVYRLSADGREFVALLHGLEAAYAGVAAEVTQLRASTRGAAALAHGSRRTGR